MTPETQSLLLVEDEALVALDLRRRLEGMGFVIAGQCSTGETAVHLATQLKPSLVLMDIRLDGPMDGIEAAEAINRKQETPIVYLTANSDPATLRRARITEPHGFVLKPIRDRELRIAIEMALYRFRAEAVMRESREWFSAMLRNVSDAVIANDRDGAVRYMNAAAERLTGWREEEAKGKPLSEVAKLLHESTLEAKAPNGIENGSKPRTVLMPREGAALSVEEKFEKVDSAGLEGGVLSLRDVSDRRDLERQLDQKHKMEAIGRLAAGVAHDFNNLLTAIIGYSNLALMRNSGPSREDLVQIKQAGEKAAELTQQLLAFSRRQMLVPAVIDLGAMSRGIDRLLRRLIGEDIEMLTTGDRDLWAVKADQSQMEQVLMNLAVNARDAMPAGGRLTVETRNSRLARAALPEDENLQPGEYVMLAVSDTGDGMDAETRSHLFEPFFTTKAPGKGTGLGLATVYGIVKQSGGFIKVVTAPGQGTSFRIYLPAVHEPVSMRLHEETHAEADLRGNETVLVVEDEKTVRGLLRDALESRGYRVLAAEGGAEALALAADASGKSEPISMMITDVVMGDMNGPMLARQVCERLPGLKVLYISGYAEQSVVQDALAEDGLSFLRKPFTPAELTQRVRSLLDAD